jgi:O-antigen ligase
MLRAQGPIEHPILYGIMMCYALLLSRLLQGWRKRLCWVGCGIGLFLSLSSAPWEAFVLGLGLIAYCAMRLPAKWTLMTVGLALFISFIFLVSSNPLGWIFNHFTLNAETGYFRLLIWQAAGADVLESPIFGIGATDNWFRPDWLPNTIDSLWLRDAMLFGIPGSILVGVAMISACVPAVRVTTFNFMRVRDQDVILATTLEIIIVLTIFLGFTVFYWGSVWVTVGALAGLRACLGQFATE